MGLQNLRCVNAYSKALHVLSCLYCEFVFEIILVIQTFSLTIEKSDSGMCFYLHDAIPVVARGDLKQGKEGHAKVFKGSVTTHTFTWIVFIAN